MMKTMNKENVTELSLDEMENAAGGLTYDDVDAYCDVLDQMIRVYGNDIAVAWALKHVVVSYDVIDCIADSKNADGLRDRLHRTVNELGEK